MSLERKAQFDLVLAVRLTPELNHKLKKMEKQLGLKRSAVIRMILTTATQTLDLARALMSHGETLVKDRRSARKEQVARLR